MKFWPALFFFFINHSSFGQLDPVFSGDVGEHSWLNPATFGINNKLGVYATYRIDWVSAEVQPHPHKYLFSAESSFVLDKEVLPEEAWKSTIGVGINIVGDHFYETGTQYIKVPISKPIKIYSSRLSFGIAPGLVRRSFLEEYTAPTNPSDPTIVSKTAQANFDLDIGAHWNNEQIFASFSVVHLTSPRFKGGKSRIPVHYYFSAKAKIDIWKCKIIPTLMIRNNDKFSALETQVFFQFKNEIATLGIGNRYGQAIIFSAATKIKQFGFAYFYDMNSSKLTNAVYGSHEFRLSYQIPNK
jgi:type IX secretion system PorP/SprF family membrane protein